MDFDDIPKADQQNRPERPASPQAPQSKSYAKNKKTIPSRYIVLAKEVSKRARRIPKRLLIIIGGATIIAAAICLLIVTLTQTNEARPDYATVLPSGKSIQALGGWKRVSPPNAAPIFAYSDTISTIPITVSQQPVPESFTANPAQSLKEMAKAFFADTEIGTTGAYIGTSAKGPQSVLLIKGETLVLIKSQKNISQKDWETYINTLR